jgi:hypothetical protein
MKLLILGMEKSHEELMLKHKQNVTVHGPIVERYKNMVEIVCGRGKLTRISQKAS